MPAIAKRSAGFLGELIDKILKRVEMEITSTDVRAESEKELSKYTILTLVALSAIIFAVYMVSPYVAEIIVVFLGVVSMLFTMILIAGMPKDLEMLKRGPIFLLPLMLFTAFGLSTEYMKEGFFTNTVMDREATIDRVEQSSNGEFLTMIGDSRYKIMGNLIQGDKVKISKVIYKKSDRVKHIKFCMIDTCSFGDAL
jgi:hypothetical protein